MQDAPSFRVQPPSRPCSAGQNGERLRPHERSMRFSVSLHDGYRFGFRQHFSKSINLSPLAQKMGLMLSSCSLREL